ncbi:MULTISPECIES: antiterminator Q family protein [Citrobacter]|uniref:antiterminator Q family protein n=1 Tax=Citrobacter TaxID=544 RepID=UPI000FDCBFB2|nr:MULTISPECIES: antiterminator Q family protein [Citrobacter]ELK6101648.1 antitermination protein [Citrobacter freundii]MDM3197589.1 antiterminator Q family protein [Citrobacter sp. Cf095]MDT7295919.1 antiterminator Q family protein [Citrobacter freundii]MDT7361311.1 antiterminator Q family protein [Citrobacter freundii]MDT7417756.1 antiterminator Q family protein [Citrobacter freundii]
MRDMYEVMDRWGAWAAADSSGVDWQPIAAGFKGLLPHGKKLRAQCNDDDGILIDGCVAKLRKHRPEVYELVIAHFVLGISLRTVAKKRKCSDGTVRKELQTALGFIDGMLYVIK